MDAEQPFACYDCQPASGPPGVRFWAKFPVCPNCGADGRTADGRDAIATLVVTHYAVNVVSPSGRVRGTGARLCDGKTVTQGETHASSVESAVNCRACLAALTARDAQLEDDTRAAR